MTGWRFRYEGFDPDEEPLREALCTLGNGYMATRAAIPGTSADGVHYPGTYVGGVYNRLTSEVAGERIENESIVNVPDWLVLQFAIDDGPWVEVSAVELLDYEQEVDLRRGLLERRYRFRDDEGRTTGVVERRLVHMEREHTAALELTVTAEDWSGRLRIRSGVDAGVENLGVERYRDLASDHLEVLEHELSDDDPILLVRVETRTSKIRIAVGARTVIRRDGDPVEVERAAARVEGRFVHDLAVDVTSGDAVTAEKVVAVYTSRDHAVLEPGAAARTEIDDLGSFEQLLERHTVVWGHLWDRFRIELDLDEDMLRILRLHLFHLLQTVSPNSIDRDVGVPPRGLHGEAYRGLIMWDEVFVLPVLDLRWPTLTRSLLAYRYRRLPAARRAARDAGYEGAMFPWQSSINGEEVAQEIHLNPVSGRWLPDPTHLQRHIGLAVAYNVWQYHQTTGDDEFLSDMGAEVLIEVARFFASLTTHDAERDRYEIRGVVGPDEFHTSYPDADEPGLNNNAYTNVMAAWLFRQVVELPDQLPAHRWAELEGTLELRPDELDRWATLSRRIVVPFHDGVISQYEGYEDLEELDWDRLQREYGDIHRLDRILEAEDDSPDRYKASKQADVLMLFYLFSADELREVFEGLGYELAPETIRRTVDYYLERTSHGSTLSSVVHGWVLARSRRDHAVEFFTRALKSDVTDIQGGTTPEGIHLGAMAGSVDLLLRCFTGLEARDGRLHVNPYWPKDLAPLEFDITYRDHPLTLHVSGESMRISSAPSGHAPITVCSPHRIVELCPGESVEFSDHGVRSGPSDRAE